MYVRRPYLDGLVTLWFGFSLGANDGNFDRFSLWVQSERYPAPGGHRNALSVDAILRAVVTGGSRREWTTDDDDNAVAMLGQLIDEFDEWKRR